MTSKINIYNPLMNMKYEELLLKFARKNHLMSTCFGHHIVATGFDEQLVVQVELVLH